MDLNSMKKTSAASDRKGQSVGDWGDPKTLSSHQRYTKTFILYWSSLLNRQQIAILYYRVITYYNYLIVNKIPRVPPIPCTVNKEWIDSVLKMEWKYYYYYYY